MLNIKITRFFKMSVALFVLALSAILVNCSKSSDSASTTAAGVFPSSLGYTQPAGIK